MASIMLDALKGQLCSKLAGIMFTPIVGTIICTLGLAMHKRVLVCLHLERQYGYSSNLYGL